MNSTKGARHVRKNTKKWEQREDKRKYWSFWWQNVIKKMFTDVIKIMFIKTLSVNLWNRKCYTTSKMFHFHQYLPSLNVILFYHGDWITIDLITLGNRLIRMTLVCLHKTSPLLGCCLSITKWHVAKCLFWHEDSFWDSQCHQKNYALTAPKWTKHRNPSAERNERLHSFSLNK